MSTKPNDDAQLDRFKEAGRQLGCDEDEAVFDEKLKVIARQKPHGANEVRAGKTKTPPS